MANLGFRMDCNLVLDMFGTSNKLTKYGVLDASFINFTNCTKTSHCYKHYFYISTNSGPPRFSKVSKRQAPRSDEEPFNEILKILDARPISLKRHEWDFANMVPLSITKHKMTSGVW